MGELEKVNFSLDGLMPLCLALQSFLGFLWLLDSLGVEVNVVVHRMWELWRFEVGVDLSVPLRALGGMDDARGGRRALTCAQSKIFSE